MNNQKQAQKFEEERKQDLMEKSLQENIDIRKKTTKEIRDELNKFKMNKKEDSKDNLMIEENLEKTLGEIYRIIEKLENKNKDLVRE
jgi:hypothetical protein